MNNQDKKIAAFARMSDLVVNRQIRDKKIHAYDYLGGMINNMQHINTVLMKVAIKTVKKLSNNTDINSEQLIDEFRKIIYGSVQQYVRRA